ncbi:MAG: PKD domain-containing protein, partial [Syntrophales bacterium]|nr:PKD domain-containing protein [Syntrophales bacterium]
QTVPPTAPTADFNWTDLGDGDHVLFTDDSTAVTGTTLTSWSWTFDGGEVINMLSEQNPGSISFGGAGNYVVSLRVTNNLGQSDTMMTMVTVEPEPVTP